MHEYSRQKPRVADSILRVADSILRVANSILDVHSVKGPKVTLTVGDVANLSQVTTTNDHDQMTVIELDEVIELSSGDVKLDRTLTLMARSG